MGNKGKKRLRKINDEGRLIGEDHQCRPKLTDADVELIRDLREENGMSYGAIRKHMTALKGFEVSKQTIAYICRYERRNSTMAGTRVDYGPDDGDEDTRL